MPEAWPTESAATAAVEAAAAEAHRLSRQVIYNTLPPSTAERLPVWEQEPPQIKHQWRQEILPLVWAALNALPDPRHAAWEEGLASADYDFESGQIEAVCNNPYPSGV